MSSENKSVGGASRADLRAEVQRGVALLSALIDAPHGLVGMRTSGRVAAARAEVVRMLERSSTVVIVTGERPVAETVAAVRHEKHGFVEILRGWWRRIVAWVSGRRALPASTETEPPAGLGARLERLLASSEARASLGAADGVEIVDMRGAHERIDASRADACLLVVQSTVTVGTPIRAATQALSAAFPHLLVRSGDGVSRADVAAALSIDESRLLMVSLEGSEVEELVENERILGASARCNAAIRLAVAAIDDALARDADLDRAAIARLEQHRIDDPSALRTAALREVTGACAGRAVRILERAASVLEREIGRLRAECEAAVRTAESRQEILDHVAAVAPAVHRAYDVLEARTRELADGAVEDLLPAVQRVLTDRVKPFVAALSAPPSPPTWPPPRRIEGKALITSAALERNDLLHADMKWSDGLLRSLEKVKQRSTAQLADQLDALDREAQAEILGAEPRVAQALTEALDYWLDDAVRALVRWVEEAISAEHDARDAARAEKHARLIGERDELEACAGRLLAACRALSTEVLRGRSADYRVVSDPSIA